jgi:hypothetical protein
MPTAASLPIVDFHSWSTNSEQEDDPFTTELLEQFDMKSFMIRQNLLLVNARFILHLICCSMLTNLIEQ